MNQKLVIFCLTISTLVTINGFDIKFYFSTFFVQTEICYFSVLALDCYHCKTVTQKQCASSSNLDEEVEFYFVLNVRRKSLFVYLTGMP